MQCWCLKLGGFDREPNEDGWAKRGQHLPKQQLNIQESLCVEGVILTGACRHLGEDCFRQKPNGYERFPTMQALCRALWPLL